MSGWFAVLENGTSANRLISFLRTRSIQNWNNESATSIATSAAMFDRYNRLGKETLTAIFCNPHLVAPFFPAKLPNASGYFRAATAQLAADGRGPSPAVWNNFAFQRGENPAHLKFLVPEWKQKWKPHDVIGAESYCFRLADPDHYVIYSIGWNETDDGGAPGESLFNRDKDWTWSNFSTETDSL